ncbi:MAG TPA: hypothetical protein VHT24_10305 [Pseudacidobacterium sp.]|jgi:hypothetical protein|nr:hypothetical protein [Pseudacidobacterium sp.]
MSKLRLRIFDGTRQPFATPAQFLVRIVDGNQKQQVWQYYQQNDLTFDLPFFDNFGDNYSVLVSCDGYKQAGFVPVKLSNAYLTTQDIMLISNSPQFNFASGRWAAAKAAYPFLASDASDAQGEQRYDNLLENQPKSLACILNICEAMSQISLSQGTPLTYLKQLIWPGDTLPSGAEPPAQDRFFGWCDPALVDQIKIAASAGQFAVEVDPGLLHPGATSSWKQVQFGEANVQFTFHQNNVKIIDGVNCVMIEPDIDYYKDPLAHVLLEVLVNALTHTLTDPAEVYVLRWMAGQTAGIPEFKPLYTIR